MQIARFHWCSPGCPPQVRSEEAVPKVGELSAEGAAISVDALFLGAFRRKGGQPGFR